MNILMGIMTFRRLRKREMEVDEVGQNEDNGTTAGDVAGSSTGDDSGAGEGNGTGTNGNAGDGATGAGDGTNAGVGGTGTGNAGGTGDGTPGNASGSDNEQDSAPKLTQEEYNEIMRNKGNVMEELKKHGAEFSDRTGADELRDLLNEVLMSKGLLPD